VLDETYSRKVGKYLFEKMLIISCHTEKREIFVETISITRTYILLLLWNFIIYDDAKKGNKGESVSGDESMTRGIWPSLSRFYSQPRRRHDDDDTRRLCAAVRFPNENETSRITGHNNHVIMILCDGAAAVWIVSMIIIMYRVPGNG